MMVPHANVPAGTVEAPRRILALMDIAGFLRRYPPFDGRTQEQLQQIAGSVEVEHFARGDVVLEQGGRSAHALYIVRKGAVELVDDGIVVDLLGEGEIFGELSLLTGEQPTVTVRAHEDTLCYLVPARMAEELLATGTGRNLVLGRMRRRIQAIRERAEAGVLGPQYREVRSLVRREPVLCAPDATVAEAASAMAAERVSCLLIPMQGGTGILTDRDLRIRVVAARRDYATRVEDVATFPVRTLSADVMAGEALLEMFADGVHHFPLTEGDGRIIGVVTDTDLMGLGRFTPFAIRSGIQRAADPDEAIEVSRELPNVVVALVESSADPIAVGHVVALVVDALTRRLLELAMAKLGDPPAPWAWLALGSAARHEQALHTDQDHAMAFDPGDRPAEELDPYFAEVAELVTAGLEAAGIPRCNGDAMAITPSLRRPVQGWVEAFHRWMNDAGREGSILTSIVFDYRQVAGPLDMESVLDTEIRNARSNSAFLRHLARRALDAAPPTGFFGNVVVAGKGEHAGTLDVKRRGITTIGNLARTYAVRAGMTNKRTLERLRVAADAGELGATDAQDLEEAFRYLWEVRLRHQVQQVRDGKDADDFVDPSTLGPVARRGLREAFRIIRRAQATLASDLGVRPP
jgi:CBS domain-containing protein